MNSASCASAGKAVDAGDGETAWALADAGVARAAAEDVRSLIGAALLFEVRVR